MAPPHVSRRSPAIRVALTLLTALVGAVTALGWSVPTAALADEPPGVWPLDPRPEVVRGFDPPDVRWGSGHRGVDLAGRVGQPVRAALPGTVSFAGRVAGRGVVVVDHGATRTTYEPVTASVRRGAPVNRGQVIGRLAWFGTHCLPDACLHWGLRAGETYLDPLQLVGGPRPVRLLPVSGAAPLHTAGTGLLPAARSSHSLTASRFEVAGRPLPALGAALGVELATSSRP